MSQPIDMATLEASLMKPIDMALIEASLIKPNTNIVTLSRPKKKKVIYSANVAYPSMFRNKNCK